MEYRVLGKTGISVSELCFGTMSFGGDADRAESLVMFRACRDAGINFFDCADVYQNGTAEEYLGVFAQGSRHELVITSKCHGSMGNYPNAGGASRKHIRDAVHNSLKRLKTDYIDIYFLHQFDPHTDLEVSLRAMTDLVQSGEILHLGVSNYAAWQIMKALSVSRVHELTEIHCIEPMYNLVKRQAEVEILPLALDQNLGVITYSPLGGGLLTGKYGTAQRPKEGRLVDNQAYGRRYGEDIYYQTAEAFTEKAKRFGLHPVSLAIAWAAAHPGVTAPIIGARDHKQLEPALDAVRVNMTDSLYREVTALSPDPPPAHDRSEAVKK